MPGGGMNAVVEAEAGHRAGDRLREFFLERVAVCIHRVEDFLLKVAVILRHLYHRPLAGGILWSDLDVKITIRVGAASLVLHVPHETFERVDRKSTRLNSSH